MTCPSMALPETDTKRRIYSPKVHLGVWRCVLYIITSITEFVQHSPVTDKMSWNNKKYMYICTQPADAPPLPKIAGRLLLLAPIKD